MKNIRKKLFVALLFLATLTNATAQSEAPLAYLEKTFPQLTELFRQELSSYPAHYIFAVDVSGTMRRYDPLVTSALTPFFRALPDGDRVDVIPFGTEAMTSALGFSGVIDNNVKNTLCDNIKTLYTNPSYTRAFRAHTDIPSAVNGIANVALTNQGYKVRIVVVITDFRNDQRGVGECKIAPEDLTKMYNAVSAATGDVYTRFIALQLPVNQNAPGYCLNQLAEKVFAFDGHNLEVASAANDQNVIRQWFEQLKREIMVTKLKGILYDANKTAPVEMKIDKNIDGEVTAQIKWTPSKLYPTIKIDQTTCGGESFVFVNNTENFAETQSQVIDVELGQIRHNKYGFHYFDESLNLGLTLPTPYDKELAMLNTIKPIPETSITSPGWIFTFFLSFPTTVTIIILIILYIIGVIKAINRNRKFCFQANVIFKDQYGSQIGSTVRISKQDPNAKLVFGKGATLSSCRIDGAEWSFVVTKKNGNPLLLFKKPCFYWQSQNKYVAAGGVSSGTFTDSLTLKCGTARSNITHGVKINIRN